MKILSLFDGISVAQQALKELGIECTYYASEVDKYAISITQKNFPKTIQLGNIKDIDCTGYQLHYGMGRLAETNIDLIVGGSPCQDLSIAKKDRKGLDGERSGLFWEYVRILKEVKPKYFVLENVNSMPKEAKETITKTLGVEPIMINAALVSAQNRKRLFWVGKLVGDKYEQVEITQPADKGIVLKDILEEGLAGQKSYCLPATYYKENVKSLIQRKKTGLMVLNGNNKEKLKSNTEGGQGDRIYSPEGKSVNLSANGGGRGAKTGLYLIQTPRGNNKGGARALNGKTPTLSSSAWEHNNKLVQDETVRKLTCIECERLQSLPDDFTAGISNSQRYKALGNAFNCEVVKHILKNFSPSI